MLPLMGPTNGLGVEKTGTPQMFMQPARPNFQEVVETTRDAFDSSCRKFGFHKQNQPSVCILFPPPKWFLRFLNSRGSLYFPKQSLQSKPWNQLQRFSRPQIRISSEGPMLLPSPRDPGKRATYASPPIFGLKLGNIFSRNPAQRDNYWDHQFSSKGPGVRKPNSGASS